MKSKKYILNKIYENYMNSTSNELDRKKPDHLNLKKIFIKDDYHRIMTEVRESESADSFVFKEYGYLSNKVNDSIVYCCLSAYGEKYGEFKIIKTLKGSKKDFIKKTPDFVIKHYKKLSDKNRKDCDYLALNSKYKWDLSIFQKLLKKNLIERKRFFDESGVYYENKEKFDKLNKSTDPSIYDIGRIHPDIIIYLFDQKGNFKSKKKIKPYNKNS